MKITANDQMPESLRKTAEIERQKAQQIEPGKSRSQADEDANKTKDVEEAKGKPGGAL